jgi:hypothetical protein
LTGTPVAALILIHPGVEFKSVKRDTLFSNTDLGDKGANLCVKSIAIHTQIVGGITQA